MGACIGTVANHDKYSSDFTKESPISKFRDQHYIAFIESKNIFKDREVLLRELLKIVNPLFLDENQKYIENLTAFPAHILYIAFLFLTQCDFKTISNNYLLLVDKVKNKYFEYYQKKLDDLNRSEYEVLKEVLICYCRIVSSEIVHSSLQVEKAKREANIVNKDIINTYGKEVFNNLKKLQLIYHYDIVEKFVVNFLLLNLNASSNIKNEDLFLRIFDYLNHEQVRLKLREIFDDYYTISFDNKTSEFVMKGLNNKYDYPEKVKQTTVNPNDAIQNKLLVSSVKPITSTVIASLEPVKTDNLSTSINSFYSSSNPKYTEGQTYSKYPPITTHYYTSQEYTDNQAQLVSSSKKIVQDTINESKPLIYQASKSTESTYDITPLNFDNTKFNFHQFKTSFLNFHNTIRKKHQANELVEDSWLSNYAQVHANFIAEFDQLTPSGKVFGERVLGENIGKVSGITNEAVESILKDWYEKRKIYDFQNPKYQPEAGDFTQMIWKETKQIGFGVGFSKSGNAYVTVNYYPQGNSLNGFSVNVSPASY